MGEEQALMDKTVETIFVLCRGYGFDILRYPDNLHTYLTKKLPGAANAVDACVEVIRTPGFVDCLMWCRYYASDPEMLGACEDAFTEMLRASGSSNVRQLEQVFRRLVRQAAGF